MGFGTLKHECAWIAQPSNEFCPCFWHWLSCWHLYMCCCRDVAASRAITPTIRPLHHIPRQKSGALLQPTGPASSALAPDWPPWILPVIAVPRRRRPWAPWKRSRRRVSFPPRHIARRHPQSLLTLNNRLLVECLGSGPTPHLRPPPSPSPFQGEGKNFLNGRKGQTVVSPRQSRGFTFVN